MQSHLTKLFYFKEIQRSRKGEKWEVQSGPRICLSKQSPHSPPKGVLSLGNIAKPFS